MVHDITDLADAVNRGGVIVVLVAGLVVAAWVVRWLLARLLEAKDAAIAAEREEKQSWRTIALGNQRTAESTVALAEHQVGLR